MLKYALHCRHPSSTQAVLPSLHFQQSVQHRQKLLRELGIQSLSLNSALQFPEIINFREVEQD